MALFSDKQPESKSKEDHEVGLVRPKCLEKQHFQAIFFQKVLPSSSGGKIICDPMENSTAPSYLRTFVPNAKHFVAILMNYFTFLQLNISV